MKKGRKSTAQENYLKTILKLVHENGTARVRDIAASVNVHKSTVTAALKALAEKKLVNYSPYKLVTLTDSGQQQAEELLRTHKTIENFLTKTLLVPNDIAGQNACRMEHVIDRQTLDRLAMFVDFINHRGGNIIDEFATYIRNNKGTN
ncbi:MAG: metal-dependent transcriptional regulator [Lentisphaerae bacterium]|nr:metal-dependent transcriptional regulator [Lentisphaerota bacterium]